MDLVIDGSKILILLYILSVYFLPGNFLTFSSSKLVIIVWLATALGLYLFVDPVVGLLLVVALIVSLVRWEKPIQKVHVRYATPVPSQSPQTPPTPESPSAKYTQVGEHYESPDDDTDNKGKVLASKAIEKYVVDDYLHKASSDGIIAENYSKFPNALGVQYNIQGIEKDMVGYNIGYNPAYTSD